MAGKLFIVSAPSGAGKTSLIYEIIRQIGSLYNIKRVVTYTSRTPRFQEKDGYDYHFISPHEFGQRVKKGFFLEWSSVYTSYYGSPYQIVDEIDNGALYIMALDRAGAQQIALKIPQAILIWMHLSDIHIAQQRLEDRATENSNEIADRMQIAKREAQDEIDSPIYHHHVFHEDFNKTVFHLLKIIRSYVSGSY